MRKKMQLPFIPVKKQIILPQSMDEIRVGKKNSVLALQSALDSKESNNKILITFIKEQYINAEVITSSSMLEDYGVVALIKESSENKGVYKISLDADKIVKINEIHSSDTNPEAPLIYASFEYKNEKGQKVDIEKIKNSIEYLNNFVLKLEPQTDKNFSSISKQVFNFEKVKDFAMQMNSLVKYNKEEKIDELIWKNFAIIREAFTRDELLGFLSLDIYDLIKNIADRLAWKKESTNIDIEITKKLNEEMESSQRDFLLREKMKQLRQMLNDESQNNAENMEKDPETSRKFPKYVIEALKTEQARLAAMMASSPEANISKTYIDLILALPWRKVSKELIDINHVREVLNKHHFGLEKPKKRILEFISVLTHKQNQKETGDYLPIKNDSDHFIDTKLFVHKTGDTLNNPVNNIPILTLIGPPGTGKTTLAKSIAEALKRKFIKVSLGGVKDESEIRGHRKTYVGAMPGKIISAIKKAGVSNPVILLDEIDKMSSDFRGDPTSAMLEVLDPEQNANFQDHYLDLEYDLSKVLFIATANYFDSIPPALVDRVELLELSTYTTAEKLEIAKAHLMPKVLEQNSLKESQIQIDDEVIKFIILSYTRESGVRELKRLLDNIARKIVVKILDNEIKDEFRVSKDVVVDFLGPIRFEDDENENRDQIGVVNGLAYTSFGGSTLAIEVTTFPGKDGIKLTGHLKEVMKESAQIALGYVRANAEKFGINFDFDNKAIHIHVPAGAIPKDGPSAGVTFTTSIISALTRKPVPANIGMTGEITLRGKVLPIGGLKEKSLAACQFGIKKIFIPYDNIKNLVDVPEEVKKEVTFVPVKYYEEIFDDIFKTK
ncbi:endopeptidase La [Mycoplasma sp. 2575]